MSERGSITLSNETKSMIKRIQGWYQFKEGEYFSAEAIISSLCERELEIIMKQDTKEGS